MKIKKCLSLLFVLGMVLTGCKDDEGNNESIDTRDPQIVQVYAEYQQNGGTLSYDEWLASIKGEKGDKGDKGDTGETGPQGPQGEQGPKGDTGETGPQGPQGPEGQQGTQGPTGPQGTPGNNGASVLTGDGIPGASLGTNGDSYIDLSTWDYYLKVEGVWILKGNIKGADGASGQQGQQGPQGQSGPQGQTGVSVTETYIDENGDLIVKFSNGDITNAGHVKDVVMYTVNFHIDDEIIATRRVINGNTLSRPTEEETAGYSITDWYFMDCDNPVSWKFDGYFAYDVHADLDLYATFEYNTYTISFSDPVTHKHVSPITVTYDKSYELPQLSQDGYDFVWLLNDEEFAMNGVYRVPRNITLISSRSPSHYILTLNPNGGDVDVDSVEVVYKERYSLPTPFKNGYIFTGWFDGLVHIPTSGTWEYTSGKTLVANWASYVPNLFVLDLDGGACEISSIHIATGDNYNLPYPTKTGYFFNGWYFNDIYVPNWGVWKTDVAIATLRAKWISSDSYTFEKNGNDAYYIKSCNHSESVAVIPNCYNGKSITGIGSSSFERLSSVQIIDITSTVKAIGEWAFYSCINLKDIYMADGLQSIGNNAFRNCTNVTSISIPNSVTSISNSLLRDCTSLVSISLPNTVDSIGAYAFSGCTNLESIVLPNSVSSIAEGAFANCSNLTSVTISSSYVNYEKKIFTGCSSLRHLAFPCTLSYPSTIGYLFDDEEFTSSICIEQVPSSYNSGQMNFKYYIPESLSEIEITGGSVNSYAFQNFKKIRSVIIHDGVTGIGNYAFDNCRSLLSVSLPDTLSTIAEKAFRNCVSLTSITIPNSVTLIMTGAFNGCSSLTSITIPFVGGSRDGSAYENEHTYFGFIFGRPSSDDTGYVPKSLKTVVVSEGCTSIPNNAFCNCSWITSIHIPESVTSIGSAAFYNCSSLTSVNIPQSVTSIGSYAFYNCSSLTSISIPDELSSISTNTFYNCSSLTSFHIPDSVTSIGSSAFENCTSLSDVNIPESVSSIGSCAFYNCSSLQYTEFDNAYYYGNESNPYLILIKAKNKSITSCEIHENTKYIDGGAFSTCDYLTSISIPDGVVFIGESAFSYCRTLVSITLPNSIETIAGRAFGHCSSLTSIVIPNSVRIIGDSCFEYCTSLSSVTLSDSINYIDKYGFTECTNLSDFYVRVSSIESFISLNQKLPFARNKHLLSDNSNEITKVVVPYTMTSIPSKAFSGCLNLESIVFPDNIDTIAIGVLYGCTSLSCVVLGANFVVSSKAFRYCTNLEKVLYHGTKTEWESKDHYEEGLDFTDKLHYYSESEPLVVGNYWHYVDGAPTVW